MARQAKNIVDYFPHSCNHSKTMFILDSQYGNDGYAFWFRLLEAIGKTDNHFLDLNNKADFLFLVAETRVSGPGCCQELLDLLSDLDAIDSVLWNQSRIVWVQKFVDGIADVYKKRGRETPRKPVPDTRNTIPDTRNAITVTEKRQSKVKYSKVKESKEEQSKKPSVKKSVIKPHSFPETETLTEPYISAAEKLGYTGNIEMEFLRFKNYWLDKQNVKRPGWIRTWNSWISRAVEKQIPTGVQSRAKAEKELEKKMREQFPE